MATSSNKATLKPVQKLGAQQEPGDGMPVKKSKKKFWIMLIALLLLGGGGAGGWYFFFNDNSEQTATAKAVPPIFVSLDPAFTVNLQPDPAEHFLQAGITLQVSKKEEVELLKLHMPQIRSRVLLLLSSKKSSEISSVEGKNKLAQEIAEKVNQPFSPQMGPQAVANVFFTSFVVQ